MATRLTIMRDELTNDPLAVGYAGMTDQQVYDSVTLANIVREDRTIESRLVKLNLSNRISGNFSALDAAEIEYNKGEASTYPDIVSAMRILNSFDVFDFAIQKEKDQLIRALDIFVAESTLVPINGILVGWKNNITATASRNISRAEEIGITSDFGIGLIIDARAV